MIETEIMTETFVDPVEEILKDSPYAIILYNDNHNTFPIVVEVWLSIVSIHLYRLSKLLILFITKGNVQ